MTTRIVFARPPAQVGIGEGLTVAARYWAASAERWILPVVAIALASGLATWLFPASLSDVATLQRLMRMSVDGSSVDPSEVPRLVAGPLAVSIVGLVAGWFITANAIVGLRGREESLRWVVTGGLRSFAVSLLTGLTLTAIALSSVFFGPLGGLVLLIAIPVGTYLLLRLSFWTLAVFDGERVSGGLAMTWTISRRAVLRILGWTLVLLAIGLVGTLVQLVVGVALVPVSRPLADATSAAADAILTSYSILVLAVLYESQRGRRLPGAAQGPAVPRPELEPPPPPSPGPPWG